MNRVQRLKKKKNKTKQLRPQRRDFRKFDQFCFTCCDHLNFRLLVVNRLPKSISYLNITGINHTKKFRRDGEPFDPGTEH